MPKLDKGEHAPLNVTKESRHRVFVGLGWDPNERFGIIAEAKSLMGGKKVHHDLDLSCYIYDSAGVPIESVTAETESAADKTGKIYHSGDNAQGLGKGDDEQISAELKDLDEHIHHMVFVVTIESGHLFGEVEAPGIRLGDGYSDHILHEATLGKKESKDKSCYVFVHLYRGPDGWMVHNIDEFVNIKDTSELPALLDGYIG